jgi:hypothetical protein
MVILSMKHSSATTLNASLHRPVGTVDPKTLSFCVIRDAISCTSCWDCLCDELDNTTSLLDLLLSLGADVTGADDDGDSRETALAEELGVAVVQKVEDGSVSALVGEVLVTLLGGDERPELVEVYSMLDIGGTYLTRSRLTDYGLPEKVLHLVEVTHTDLSEVTGMVLVNVGAVVVLTTLEGLLVRSHEQIGPVKLTAIPRPPGCFLCFPTRP